jgi:hypothetical protein
MSENLKEAHKKFAIDCFNGTWDLLDNKNRSPEEDDNMIHMAHASRYHWGEIGTPLEFARGDWQISRVYAVLGMGAMAIKYAETSLAHCQQNDIVDFDLAFAYEALTRGSAITGDSAGGIKYKKLAIEAGDKIKDEANREYFFSELKTITLNS